MDNNNDDIRIQFIKERGIFFDKVLQIIKESSFDHIFDEGAAEKISKSAKFGYEILKDFDWGDNHKTGQGRFSLYHKDGVINPSEVYVPIGPIKSCLAKATKEKLLSIPAKYLSTNTFTKNKETKLGIRYIKNEKESFFYVELRRALSVLKQGLSHQSSHKKLKQLSDVATSIIRSQEIGDEKDDDYRFGSLSSKEIPSDSIVETLFKSFPSNPLTMHSVSVDNREKKSRESESEEIITNIEPSITVVSSMTNDESNPIKKQRIAGISNNITTSYLDNIAITNGVQPSLFYHHLTPSNSINMNPIQFIENRDILDRILYSLKALEDRQSSIESQVKEVLDMQYQIYKKFVIDVDEFNKTSRKIDVSSSSCFSTMNMSHGNNIETNRT
jgi:hypothetical protein